MSINIFNVYIAINTINGNFMINHIDSNLENVEQNLFNIVKHEINTERGGLLEWLNITFCTDVDSFTNSQINYTIEQFNIYFDIVINIYKRINSIEYHYIRKNVKLTPIYIIQYPLNLFQQKNISPKTKKYIDIAYTNELINSLINNIYKYCSTDYFNHIINTKYFPNNYKDILIYDSNYKITRCYNNFYDYECNLVFYEYRGYNMNIKYHLSDIYFKLNMPLFLDNIDAKTKEINNTINIYHTYSIANIFSLKLKTSNYFNNYEYINIDLRDSNNTNKYRIFKLNYLRLNKLKQITITIIGNSNINVICDKLLKNIKIDKNIELRHNLIPTRQIIQNGQNAQKHIIYYTNLNIYQNYKNILFNKSKNNKFIKSNMKLQLTKIIYILICSDIPIEILHIFIKYIFDAFL